MKQNDMKPLVYLILALICFYYLLDDFFGKNKITNWVNNFIGNFGGPPAKTTNNPSDQAGTTATGTVPAAVPAKAKTADGSVKIPQPQGADGSISIPVPQNKQGETSYPTTKPATNTGWNPFPNLSFPSIFGIPAAVPEVIGGTGLAILSGLEGGLQP